MTIKVQCPNPECTQHYKVRESHLGRNVMCRKCGREFTIGASERETARPPVLSDTAGAVLGVLGVLGGCLGSDRQ